MRYPLVYDDVDKLILKISTEPHFSRYTTSMFSFSFQRSHPLLKKGFFLSFIFGSLFFGRYAFGEMSSTNYLLQWDAISVGASDTQSSASYQVRSSLDLGLSAENMSSALYALDGGYRAGVYDPVAAFRIFSQNISTQVAATARSGTSVTVTSASGFAVNDRIIVIENEGASQVSAMGKILSIAGTTLTVDAFSGGSPTIDGSGGDYVYLLTPDGTTLPLSGPTSSTVVTGIIAWEATVDIQNGYAAYVVEGGNLASASDEIPDVADGAVTAGSSEYGAISSDTSLASSTFDTQDTAITSSLQLVASRAAVQFSERDYLTLKLGMSATQEAGVYTQNLSILFAGNY